MSSILEKMSVPKAAAVLQNSKLNNAALAQVTNAVLSGKTHLRQPKGYSGI